MEGKKSQLQLKFNTRNMCQSQCLRETRHRLALHADVVRAPPLMNTRAKTSEHQLVASHGANRQLQKTWIGKVTQSEVFWLILFLVNFVFLSD